MTVFLKQESWRSEDFILSKSISQLRHQLYNRKIKAILVRKRCRIALENCYIYLHSIILIFISQLYIKRQLFLLALRKGADQKFAEVEVLSCKITHTDNIFFFFFKLCISKIHQKSLSSSEVRKYIIFEHTYFVAIKHENVISLDPHKSYCKLYVLLYKNS